MPRRPGSLQRISSKGLADYFEAAHHTLYRVSTATALVEGIYQAALRIGTLRETFWKNSIASCGNEAQLPGELGHKGSKAMKARSDI